MEYPWTSSTWSASPFLPFSSLFLQWSSSSCSYNWGMVTPSCRRRRRSSCCLSGQPGRRPGSLMPKASFAVNVALRCESPSTFLAPQVSILCRDHLESLNWPHLVIWQRRFHNTTPHLYSTVALKVKIWRPIDIPFSG